MAEHVLLKMHTVFRSSFLRPGESMLMLRLEVILICYLETFSLVFSINPFKKDGAVDYSASAFDVQKLVKHEQKLIKVLLQYKDGLERQVESIRRYMEDYESGTRLRGSLIPNSDFDPEKETDIVKHPLKTYRLIRRFVHDLPVIQNEIEIHYDTDFLNEVGKLKDELQFPKEEDLEGAMLSLIRLKQTYNLPLKELVSGNLNGIMTNSGLNAENCFEIGKTALSQEVLSTAIEFFEAALDLTESKESSDYTEREKLLEEAIQKHDEFLESGKFERDKNPFHFPFALHSVRHLNFKSKFMESPAIDAPEVMSMKSALAAFDKLCRGESTRNASSMAELKCTYLSGGKVHPFFILNPLKVEFQNMNPPILQIYNVLSEKQMEIIKKEAEPEMSRSQIVSFQKKNDTTKATSSSYRTSSNTWILDAEPGNPFNFVNERVEMITRLNLKPFTSREILQIANYAPGGFYTPHYDAVHEPSILSKLGPQEFVNGDRMATFMIYLSDVDSGGGTAFPVLGVFAQPVRGSALFWFNLHDDGSINRKTLHGGCPVLYGNKWVANKWIRSHDQMFVRKCPTQQSKDVWL